MSWRRLKWVGLEAQQLRRGSGNKAMRDGASRYWSLVEDRSSRLYGPVLEAKTGSCRDGRHRLASSVCS